MAVKQATAVVVGHVPCFISPICSVFLRRGGTINCRVTGTRKYSSDLSQGELEIPCLLYFKANDAKECSKTNKLFRSAVSQFSEGNNNEAANCALCASEKHLESEVSHKPPYNNIRYV